jgi:hypothetical protein
MSEVLIFGIYVALSGLGISLTALPRAALCLPWALIFCPFRADDTAFGSKYPVDLPPSFPLDVR